MSIVLACGSRDFTNREIIAQTLEAELRPGDTLLHGGASGADRLSGYAATGLGFPVHVMPAQWSVYGKRAGIIRNREMLDQNPRLVIAFWDGQSRGTAYTIHLAQERNIPVKIVRSMCD